MKRPSVWIASALVLMAAVALAALSAAVAPEAAAADSAPRAAAEQPAQSDSTAAWVVTQDVFASLYPEGFRFNLAATSSGGDIVRARVEWSHRPGNVRPGQTVQVRRADGLIDTETGQITATWTPSGATAVPPWVGVEYRWRLRDAAGNEFVTETQRAEYADLSKEWLRTETDEVIVFSNGLGDAIGDLVGAAMDTQRAKYQAAWGDLLPYRPRVILFGDVATWLEWQVGHQDTTGLGGIRVGVTSDEWGATVQVLYGTPEDLAFGVVLHEIAHLYQSEFLSGRLRFTPGWFTEGNATYFELGSTPPRARQHAVDAVSNGRLPVLLQGSGPTTGGANWRDGYYIGYTFFAWLEERWDVDMHRQLMALLAQDLQFTDALEQATGMTVNELESAWRMWLGASSDVPTLIPTPTLLPFPQPPTPMTFGS